MAAPKKTFLFKPVILKELFLLKKQPGCLVLCFSPLFRCDPVCKCLLYLQLLNCQDLVGNLSQSRTRSTACMAASGAIRYNPPIRLLRLRFLLTQFFSEHQRYTAS